MIKYLNLSLVLSLILLSGCMTMSTESKIKISASTIGYTAGKIVNNSDGIVVSKIINLINKLSTNIPSDGNIIDFWKNSIDEYQFKLSDNNLTESQLEIIKSISMSMLDGITYLVNNDPKLTSNINNLKIAVESFCNAFMISVRSIDIDFDKMDRDAFIHLRSSYSRRVLQDGKSK